MAKGIKKWEEVREEWEATPPHRLVKMAIAMAYLDEHGWDCKNRNTFYGILRSFKIPYKLKKPDSIIDSRLFSKADLEAFVNDPDSYIRTPEEIKEYDAEQEAKRALREELKKSKKKD